MKTIVSVLIALSVLAGIAAPASAFDAKSFYEQLDRTGTRWQQRIKSASAERTKSLMPSRHQARTAIVEVQTRSLQTEWCSGTMS